MSALVEVGITSVAPVRSPRSATSRRQRWMLVGIFLLMAALQIGLAGRQCLWVDEIFSLAIATGHSLEHPAAVADPARGDFVEPNQPIAAEELGRYLKHDDPPAGFGRVVRAVLLSDTSPPLYYVLLNIWTRMFGTGDVAFRLFSVACSLVSFPFFAGFARRTIGRRGVIPACLLFAFSPLALYFSGEGRMYSLLLLCAIAMGWASLVLRQGGGTVFVYSLWVVMSAAGFLTHYFFLFPWIAMIGYLVISSTRSDRWRLLACILLVGLAILPWYALAAGSADHWRITEGWLYLRPTDFHRFKAIRNHFLQFFSSAGSGLWKVGRWSSVPAIALFALVAGVMIWRWRLRIFTGARMPMTLWFLLVCASPTIVDFVQHTYFTNNPRYTVAALPAAYLLAALGLRAVGRRTGLVILVLILLAWTPAIINIYRQPDRNGEPFREVAQSASSINGASDLVLVHSIPAGILGIARYADGALTLASWIQQLGNRRAPESIEMLAANRRRILFIMVHPLEEPRPDEAWLRANATIAREEWVDRIMVIDFRRPDVAAF